MPILTDSVSPLMFVVLMAVGAVASAINAVAGGGSLISFPFLVGFKVPEIEANATNSAALSVGSLGGALGLVDQLEKTKKYLWILFAPTLLGSILGAYLLTVSSQKQFNEIIPWLILLASLVLAFQAKVKQLVLGSKHSLPKWVGVILQLCVAVYGGYFGAGMGIMMLAAFALYIEGTIHELNAMKGWLGLLINFTAAVVLFLQGKVLLGVMLPLAIGALVGGFLGGKYSQQVDSEVLRKWVAGYGFVTAAYFFWRGYMG